MILSLIGVSMPGFWLGLVLLSYVALHVPWLPMFGRDASVFKGLWVLFTQFKSDVFITGLRHILLPATALGVSMMAIIARLTRSSLLEVLGQDYMRTAVAKGLPQRRILWVHGIKNAIIPVVTYLGPLVASVLTGSFVVENIFAVPGLGKHFVTSINNRDYTVILGVTIFYCVLLILANLLVDLIYPLLDPRIQLSDRKEQV